ncbi:MAG: bifunctional folylpolyglutamate synthase/dihydrofolate synthase [Planctomycetaceae bacterium]
MRKMRRHAAPKPEAVDRDDVFAWLDSRLNYERTPAHCNTSASFGLDRMRRLLRHLGKPHTRVPAVHVAGTKGKGSTVAMLAAILQESGLRVGRYLSPHVHQLEERISVDGTQILRSDFMAALARVRPAVESLDHSAARTGRAGPTWFEIMTAAAFVHFALAKVDIAVLETGLGGRLDATNVCDPLVTVITTISYDHMKLLGRTIGRIATEKAGIIKRGCPVISGASQPSARGTISSIAARRRAPLLQLGRDFWVSSRMTKEHDPLTGICFELRSEGHLPKSFTSPFAGRHQAENAALAVMAARQLRTHGVDVPDAAIERGLSRAHLPARIERVARDPLVIVDAAHNTASMAALVDTLHPLLVRHESRVLVFAASKDKQIGKMLRFAHGVFNHVVITRYLKNPRAATISCLRTACMSAGLPSPKAAPSPPEAVRLARSLAGRKGVVVVAGSFFLAAEVGLGTRR